MELNDYIGRVYYSNFCNEFEIEKLISENSFKNLSIFSIKFLNTGTIRKASLLNILKGEVSDHNLTIYTRYGGTYTKSDTEGNGTAFYLWCNMLRRVNTDSYYINTTIDKSWYEFKNFLNFIQDPENCHQKGYHLDKDLLSDSVQKKYGPDTCVYIPPLLNNIIKDFKVDKVADLPSGISHIKSSNRYYSSVTLMYHSILLEYSNPVDIGYLFALYKFAKEYLIKQIAKKFFIDNKISRKAFEALSSIKIFDNRKNKIPDSDIIKVLEAISESTKNKIRTKIDSRIKTIF